MNISAESFKKIGEEIDYVLQQMKQTDTPQRALYYFSAAQGVIYRVMNTECDPILVFAHQVLSTAHANFTAQLPSLGDRPNAAVVADELLTLLHKALANFGVALNTQEDDQIYRALARIANITYAVTGNGYYLYIKGLLKLSD